MWLDFQCGKQIVVVHGQRELGMEEDLRRLIDYEVPILAMMPIHGLHERSVGHEQDFARCGHFRMIADRMDHVVRRLTVDRPHSDIRPAFLELPDRLVDQIDGWLGDDEFLACLCCTSRELNGSRRLTARERSGNPIECSH
jgi:hypothetical protein